jgi:hypothetical protein
MRAPRGFVLHVANLLILARDARLARSTVPAWCDLVLFTFARNGWHRRASDQAGVAGEMVLG